MTAEEFAAMPPEERAAMQDQMMEVATEMLDEPIVEAMPASPTEPTRVKIGSFVGADSLHQASGSAAIYALPDGRRVLRFEDLDVTNGPALSVYLSISASVNDDFAFAKLKGNQGSQNYEIPAEVDVTSIESVIIY